jgi:hypothetical protein
VSLGDLFRDTLVIHGTATQTVGGPDTAGGADTTLTADAPTGTAALAYAALLVAPPDGAYLRVGDPGESEIAQVITATTTSAALTTPLAFRHHQGDPVREVDGVGVPILDAYHQPVEGPAILATVDGLIQPRTAREAAILSQGGAVVSSHVAYIWPLAGLTTAAWVSHDGIRYDILGIHDQAGQDHHLKLDLQAVA